MRDWVSGVQGKFIPPPGEDSGHLADEALFSCIQGPHGIFANQWEAVKDGWELNFRCDEY